MRDGVARLKAASRRSAVAPRRQPWPGRRPPAQRRQAIKDQ